MNIEKVREIISFLPEKQTEALSETNIEFVMATIRKCDGLIIEVSGSDEQRRAIFDLLSVCNTIPNLHAYGLRHPCSDWTYPSAIKDTQMILVNRLGWFITTDEMKFNRNNNEVYLSSRNAIYYHDDNTEKHYWNARIYKFSDL